MSKNLKKAPKKAKTIDTDSYKVTIFSKILAFPVLIGFVILWLVDRAMHLVLPHATHPKLTDYITTDGSVKHTVARIIIFAIPVLIYKAIQYVY